MRALVTLLVLAVVGPAAAQLRPADVPVGAVVMASGVEFDVPRGWDDRNVDRRRAPSRLVLADMYRSGWHDFDLVCGVDACIDHDARCAVAIPGAMRSWTRFDRPGWQHESLRQKVLTRVPPTLKAVALTPQLEDAGLAAAVAVALSGPGATLDAPLRHAWLGRTRWSLVTTVAPGGVSHLVAKATFGPTFADVHCTTQATGPGRFGFAERLLASFDVSDRRRIAARP